MPYPVYKASQGSTDLLTGPPGTNLEFTRTRIKIEIMIEWFAANETIFVNVNFWFKWHFFS